MFLLLLFHAAFAQTWTQKASAPFAGNEGGGAFTIGANIYFASGKDRSFYLYDQSADTWTQKADLPGDTKTRTYLTAFAVSGKGYVGLGISEIGTMKKDFWEYDPTADSWTQKADFPGGIRIQAASFVINSKAYVGGGADVTGGYFNDFYAFDPSSNTWTKKAKIQTTGGYANIASPASFSLGGFGYFVGGERGPVEYHNTAQYDPVNDKWKQKASLPGNNRVAATGFSYGHLGYVGFGMTMFTTGYDDFFSYDPATDSWQLLGEFPTKTGRAYAVAAVVGNNAYIGGGWDVVNTPKSVDFNDCWQLSLPTQAAVPHVTLSVSQVDFGSLNAHSSKDTTITLHAGSDTNLVISGLQISGTGNTVYSIKNKPTLPLTVSAGKDLTLTLSFVPTDSGSFDATLTITSNAELEAAHATPLSLHGSAISITPHILLSSTMIDYGIVHLNTSIDSTLTISAGLNADLKITNIQLSDHSGVFLLRNMPSFPVTVSAGKNLKLGISFKPSAAKMYDETVTITSDAENEISHNSSIALHGLGSSSAVAASDIRSSFAVELQALPNPFRENVALSLKVNGINSEALKISLIDVLGNTVLDLGESRYEPGNHTLRIETEKLCSGKYWIVAKTSYDVLRISVVKIK